MVVVVIHYREPVQGGVALHFCAALRILLARGYVGIAEEYHRMQARCRETLHYRSAARGAAAVQQYAVLTSRDFWLEHIRKYKGFRGVFQTENGYLCVSKKTLKQCCHSCYA